jgi:hypothetical protein
LAQGSPVPDFQRELVVSSVVTAITHTRSALVAWLVSGLILGLAPADVHAAGAGSGWSTVALPLDQAAFARLLRLDEGLPRTVLLTEALRRLHEADIHGEALRATVVATLAAANETPSPAPMVPLPLTVPVWCRLVGPDCNEANVVARILGDPAAGLLFLGLSSTGEGTRTFLAAHPDLLAWLKARRPGTFAAFANSLHVVDDRIVSPTGEAAEPSWQALVGEPLNTPDPFIRKLLTIAGGRYAYLLETLDHLDAPHQRFALTMEDGDGLHALARLFASSEPAWDPESRPFVRPFFDGATLLANVSLTAEGRLAGPRAVELWSRAFDADGGEVKEDDQAALLEGSEVDAAWLVRALDSSNLRIRSSRLQAILFGQRLVAPVTADNASAALEVLRAAIRMPALVLTLERMGVHDPTLTAALVRISRRLTSRGDSTLRDRSLIIWQGALATVDRLVFMGRIQPDRAAVLLKALADAARDEQRDIGTAVTAWIRTVLLPGLLANGQPATPAGDAEGLLIAALGGADSEKVETLPWEGAVYRVDPAAAERERLAAILSRMGGWTLTQALEAAEVAHMLSGQATDADRQAAARRLTDLVAGLEDSSGTDGELEALGRDAAAVLDRAARDLAAKQSRGALRRLSATIEDAGTTMLAIALRRLTYAEALGDPEGQATLAGDVAARHTLGAERAGMPAGPLPQWALPEEEAASSRGWHVQGSLLALDVALGRLWLRRVLGDMPFHEPTLNESERRVLVASLVLLPAASLADDDRAAILSALDRGRARVREAAGDARARAALCRDGGVCGWRNELLAWSGREEPEALFSTISRTELIWLGWNGHVPPPDPWGPLTTAVDGVLSPHFQRPVPLEAVSGRAPLAQALGRFADLKLRLAELTAELGVPSRLIRDVMASALQDYLDDVRPAYPEDWPALLARFEQVTRGRVEDYVAALTAAGGPLVPDAAPAGGVR